MTENIFCDIYCRFIRYLKFNEKHLSIYYKICNIFISFKNEESFKSEDKLLHRLQLIFLFINSLIGQFIRILT